MRDDPAARALTSSESKLPAQRRDAYREFVMLDAAARRQRIEAYEASARRLEATLLRYEASMPRYRRGFALLSLAGFACFALGPLPGLWGAISATVVAVCGYLMVRARIWELRGEIDETRDDLARFERELEQSDAADDGEHGA